MFSFAYVKEFNRLEQAERERLEKQAVTLRLAVFNKAIRTGISGMNTAITSTNTVMRFLRDAYRSFSIEVADVGDQNRFYSAGIIACTLGEYSLCGNPHVVAAIIGKLDMKLGGHIEIAPDGLVGFSVLYDAVVTEAVKEWLIVCGKPHNISHNGFEYHIAYHADKSAFGDNGGVNYYGDCDIFSISDEEIYETCRKYSDCDVCPCYAWLLRRRF
jgi:hypothetical protein